MILDKETSLRFEETQKQKETMLQAKGSEIQRRIDKLEEFINSLSNF